MVIIANIRAQASNKLEEGMKNVSGQKEKAMAQAVYTQLKQFCSQDDDFAKAVINGGTFSDCMKYVAKGVGQAISDLDAYKKAVQFYFPSAEVEMKLSISFAGKSKMENKPGLVDEKPIEPEGKPKIISLNLEDFFG